MIAIAFVILAVAVWKKNHTAQAEEAPAVDAAVEAVAETAEEAPKTETQM